MKKIFVWILISAMMISVFNACLPETAANRVKNTGNYMGNYDASVRVAESITMYGYV